MKIFFNFVVSIIGTGARAFVALIGVAGISLAVANYTMTQGSGTSFGSVVVSTVHYAQQMLCDLTTPSQCAAVDTSGNVSVKDAAVLAAVQADVPNVTVGTLNATTASATKALMTACQYLASQPTMTNTQQAAVLCGARGELLVTPGIAGFPVTFSSPQAVTQSGTWTVQPGNTQNTTPWLTRPSDGTNSASIKAASTPAIPTDVALVTGHRPCSPYHLSGGTAASTNSTNIKNATGSLCRFTAINTTVSTVGYLKVYDSASAPTCSSATNLKHVYPIIAGPGGVQIFDSDGEYYANGISFCVTGGGGDTDNTSTVTGIYVEASYK